MAKTLSRTYRPATFGDVVGQEHIKKTLQNELISDAIAHAYLFAGPRGIGKTTLARIFAKALNCENKDKRNGEPCLTCVSCKGFSDNAILDVIEIDAASHTGVDTVRETVIDTARLLPSSGKYKIFIIDEVHMLSTSAFNALLKIIEEPPAHVVFIFATTEHNKVPATIISRCQRFDFKRITIEQIVERLNTIVKKEKRNVDKDVLQMIARFSDGALRDAESLLGQVLTLAKGTITTKEASLILPASHVESVRKFAAYIFENDTKRAITYVTELSDNGVQLEQFAKDLLELFRLALLKKIDASISITDTETASWLAAQENNVDSSRLELLIRSLINTIELSKSQWLIPTLPLELFIIQSTTKLN